jgi:hypothetical protein
MRPSRLRITVRRIMAVIAALCLLLALARYLALGEPSIPLELVNKTNHPIHDVEIAHPTGLIRASHLNPGESVRGRTWPPNYRHSGEFECKFSIRFANGDGKVFKSDSMTPDFDPTFYEPNLRWEVMYFDGGKEGIGIFGMADRPTSKIRKYFRSRLP